MLPHQPHDLLVIDEAARGMKFGSHAPIAIGRPLGADLLDAFDEPSLLDWLAFRLVIVGRSRKAHQPASFGNRETTGPEMTGVVPLAGWRACREAPFRNSFSSVSFPTSRSSAPMRASYSCKMLAAARSSSNSPASALAAQMRTRLRLMPCRLAIPCKVSPA